MRPTSREANTADLALRRANVLARLDIERQTAHDGYRRDRVSDLERRIERLEAIVCQLSTRLDDVASCASLAQAQAESVAGAW